MTPRYSESRFPAADRTLCPKRVFPVRMSLIRSLILAFVVLISAAPSAAQDAASTPQAGLAPAKAQALAEALKDEQSRAALVQALEQIAKPGGGANAPATANPVEEPRRSFGRIVAETTQAAVEGLVERSTGFWRELKSVPLVFAGLGGDEAAVLWDALVELFVIIAVTVAVFIALRMIARRLDRRIGARASESSLIRKAGYAASSLLLDAAVVLTAWATGYAVATLLIGDIGQVGIRQALYLNAFLVVELVKVGVRTIISPATGGLRPIALPDRGARRLYGWVNATVSILGYGQLLIVPIINTQAGWIAGAAAGVLVSVLAVLSLLAMTMIHRKEVRHWLLVDRHMEAGSGIVRFIGRYWHWPLMIYLTVLLLIVLTRPGTVLLPLLGASAQILGAIVLGAIAANAVSHSIREGLHLPADVNARLPLLERRLNAFVPRALHIVRVVIILAVIGFALHTAGIIDIDDWLRGEFGAAAAGAVASVAFMLFFGFAIWLAISSWIDYRLNPDYGGVPSARERTLLTLARNAITIVILALTVMFTLSELGIDIAPLLASAGVLGLAIGFGAQKMVQDIITGIFIQFENAINVGDVISAGGTTGTVERLTIRSVSLRDLHGVFHIIPFSSVDMVSNYMREFGHFVCDMGIAYREDIDEAKQAMLDAFEELKESETYKNDILENMTWMGLQSFGDNAVVLRSRIKCAPGKQWAVGRAYNAILKRVFDERGIEIPFPHRTIYFGEDKEGSAPPAYLQLNRPRQKSAEGAASEAKRPDLEAGDIEPPEEAPEPEADAPR